MQTKQKRQKFRSSTCCEWSTIIIIINIAILLSCRSIWRWHDTFSTLAGLNRWSRCWSNVFKSDIIEIWCAW